MDAPRWNGPNATDGWMEREGAGVTLTGNSGGWEATVAGR